MSWRLGALVILGLVLAGGFAWFERSRPSSRIIALVAALAALAVAGRLVFAPIPNVQATTDVVLFTGYALGAAPGFAVGALGALISNLWLGQGPWTPWEMAGWGLVGIGGAGLGVLTRRRLGRVGLATACALAGFAYGALLDLSVLVTAGGDPSLDRYLAIFARGVPFNIAHAVGNAALALAAGPALVRMIGRYRSRLEFRWAPQLAAPLLALALIVPALAAPRAESAATTAGWLAGQRNDDGGFGSSPGTASSAAITGWAALGLEAAGRNPLDIGRAGKTPVEYLRKHAGGLNSTGDLERTILALQAAGVGPHHFGGHDLVDQLKAARSADGSYSSQVNLTAFGVLAMRGIGKPRSYTRRSLRWLEAAQGKDGGWGFQPGSSSDPDTTGAVLQALAAAGAGRHVTSHGVKYLKADQQPDGGWPLAGNGVTNSQSTAWAVQGLIAAGHSPAGIQSHGNSGLDYLAARRSADGHYAYSASSDQTPVWVTGQALLAIQGKPFPLAVVARAPKSHHHRHHRSNGDNGGGGGDGRTPSGGTPPGGTTPPFSGGRPPAGPPAGKSPKPPPNYTDAKAAGPVKPSGPAPASASAKLAPEFGSATEAESPPAATTTTGDSPPPESGSDSHTSRYAGAGLVAVAVGGAGLLWWRRRA